MNYLLGVDVGTSSVKASLISTDGKNCFSQTEKFTYYYEENCKMMDADCFCETCFSIFKKLTDSILAEDNVLAVCISGAGGNPLFIKEGKAISPIIGWQNEFDETITEQILSDISAEEVYQSVGWPKLNFMPLSALACYKVTKPDLFKNCDTLGMHIEYLGYQLTGKWAITPSMGTTFYLIDQTSGNYNQKFLKLFDITEDKLPEIYETCSVYGQITETISQKTGLPAGIPVVCGTFDHPSAARGTGVFDENEIMVSCGTSWVVFVPYTERSIPLSKNMLVDPFMSPKGSWCGMISLTSVSEKIDELKSKYFGEISHEEFDRLAGQSEYGCNGLVMKEDATDVSGFSDSDIARAIMEYIANLLNEMLISLGNNAKVIKLVGGISNSEVWCRVISEVTKKEVKIINGEYAGAIGAAIMAGVGIGYYPDEQTGFRSMNF
ncbi:MAG: hypothetical protein J6A61_08405 [Clostridia bacterium]|nr:hypothetical protein [Clostridia bacterium]